MNPGRVEHRNAALVFAVLPALLVGRGLGSFKAPGMPTEMLFGQLFAGAQVRLWAQGGLGRATVAIGQPTWWPDAPLPTVVLALLGRVFDDGLAYGLMLAVALWLCGYGPWRWARSMEPAPPLRSALVAGLLVQASPPVLRAAASGEIGVLGVGLVALTLALARPGGHSPRVAAMALLAGAWGAPAALVLGVVALLRRRVGLAFGLLPLLLALAAPRSPLPGAAWPSPVQPGTAPAYVAENLAVLPLPPMEASPLRGAVGLRSLGGAPVEPGAGRSLLGSLGRLPGGFALLGVAAAAVLRRPRGPGLLLLGLIGGWALLFGFLPAPGEPPPLPTPWSEALGSWVPGLRPPVGSLAWLLPPLLVGAWAAARVGRPAVVLGLTLAAALLENPRLSTPVVNLAPDPVAATLAGMPAGGLVLFPNPAMPWRQGGRGIAERLLAATRHGHPVEVGAGPPRAVALVAALSQRADVAVDLEVGPLVWEARGLDPFDQAREAGFTALLVDRAALPEGAWPSLDGWLAAHIGTPIAEDERQVLYDLRALQGRSPAQPEAGAAPPEPWTPAVPLFGPP